MADAAAARRKAPNPNKDPTPQAEKKAAKAERDAKRKRDEEIKKASWKYGLGAAAVIIGGMCLYSLVTISRATIVTIALNDQAQLKEVGPLDARMRFVCLTPGMRTMWPCAARTRTCRRLLQQPRRSVRPSDSRSAARTRPRPC